MKYEIKNQYGYWLEVDIWIFRSWTGERRINGKDYSGPVYYLGTDTITNNNQNNKLKGTVNEKT